MLIDDVLVVIPCLNEEAHIEHIIRKLMSDPRPEHFLVVVADGGSTDRTCRIVDGLLNEFVRLRFIHNPNKIQASAVNLAARKYGRGFKYLLRIDAHSEYPDRFIDKLSQQLVITDAKSVVVPLETVGLTRFQKIVAIVQNSKLGTGGSAHRHKGLNRWVDHGHHALFDLQTFCELGGYNESFPYNEDAEFDLRLINAGHRIWLAGTVPITYYPRRDIFSLAKQYFRYGVGRASTIRLHKPNLKPRQWAPISIAPLCALAVAGLTIEDYVLAIPAVSWMLTCNLIGVWLSIKNRNLDVQVAGFLAMTMHLSWSLGFWKGLFALSNSNTKELPPLVFERTSEASEPKSPHSQSQRTSQADPVAN